MGLHVNVDVNERTLLRSKRSQIELNSLLELRHLRVSVSRTFITMYEIIIRPNVWWVNRRILQVALLCTRWN